MTDHPRDTWSEDTIDKFDPEELNKLISMFKGLAGTEMPIVLNQSGGSSTAGCLSLSPYESLGDYSAQVTRWYLFAVFRCSGYAFNQYAADLSAFLSQGIGDDIYAAEILLAVWLLEAHREESWWETLYPGDGQRLRKLRGRLLLRLYREDGYFQNLRLRVYRSPLSRILCYLSCETLRWGTNTPLPMPPLGVKISSLKNQLLGDVAKTTRVGMLLLLRQFLTDARALYLSEPPDLGIGVAIYYGWPSQSTLLKCLIPAVLLPYATVEAKPLPNITEADLEQKLGVESIQAQEEIEVIRNKLDRTPSENPVLEIRKVAKNNILPAKLSEAQEREADRVKENLTRQMGGREIRDTSRSGHLDVPAYVLSRTTGETEYYTQSVPRPAFSLHVLLDFSGSMLRDAEAVKLFGDFLLRATQLPEVERQVTFFLGSHKHSRDLLIELPTNPVSVQATPALLPEGHTPLAPAVTHAVKLLSQRSGRKKYLLVITDGEPTSPLMHESTCIKEAKLALVEAEGRGISVIGISLSSNDKTNEKLRWIFSRYSILDSSQLIETLVPMIAREIIKFLTSGA